jgi:hypothetical protein
MWRIKDHTQGRILAVLTEHWSGRTAQEALQRRHAFGAAMDIAHELAYLGFAWHKDFDVRPASALDSSLPTCPWSLSFMILFSLLLSHFAQSIVFYW